ncbi:MULTISPECIES: Fic family protein [unclassified Pseudomonas]|uniref:Fic family protein n=1 Tax=unclassified Pseudomonas TaxID=196821 RepID=UPI0035C02E87
MNDPTWIWQHADWPHFHWQAEPVAGLLRACTQAQGQLLGMAGAVDADAQTQNTLDALLQNIVTSSAIEGERLNVESVRSSLARRLGLEVAGIGTARSEGLAELMLDATQAHRYPLTLERLLHWHQLLFPSANQLVTTPIWVGALRGEEPMQVVSGRIDRPTVHFQAPPREGLEAQVQAFLTWFAESAGDPALDPLLRAGIAHFWFVTLHPFDDGNGRLTRAITDLALAQAEQQAIRFYAMPASILEDRRGYYEILEARQKSGLDITAWLSWFLRTLLRSLEQALARIERVLGKARFWHRHSQKSLTAEQIKVLNRLLDGDLLQDRGGFPESISASQYQSVAKVSKATASRHLSDLLEKGCLIRLPGGGRSTRYQINWND